MTPHGVTRACGAVGEPDPELVELMRASLGLGGAPVHADGRSVLFADREPQRWRSRDAFGFAWPERVPARADGARSRAEAATLGTCGLAAEGERRVVYASASGIGPLYWRHSGAAVYFATNVAPLTVAGGPPSPDWETWASIIALGYPCGDGTPFAEIKRLNPSATIACEPGGSVSVDSGELVWAGVQPEAAADVPGRIVEAIGGDLDQLDPQVPVLALLSGGLDSRLLASLLAGRGLALSAWTADTEEGQDQEELAAAVAARLGIPHSTADAQRRPFAEELSAAAELVEYQSMLHLPMERLAAALPSDGGAVVNGLGGDTFVKGLVLTEAIVGAAHSRDAVAPMFERFAPTPPVGFRPDAWEAIRAAARNAFLAEAKRFADHPSVATLTYYWTRTRRGISQSAVRLFGSRFELVLPFVSDRVVRAALAAPEHAKLGAALYREVLERANPAVAGLPSTDDAEHAPAGVLRRTERSREARATYVSLLERSPLRPWFSEALRDGLERGGLGGELRSHFGLRRLQAMCTLTLWLDAYSDALADPDPAPLFDGGAGTR
jgi:asparagine synthetase B (glutamine-hydrolysing)